LAVASFAILILIALTAVGVREQVRSKGEARMKTEAKATAEKQRVAGEKAEVIKELNYTLADVTNGTLRFFSADGTALMGYSVGNDGRTKFFPKQQGISEGGETIKPVTRDVVLAVTKTLQTEADQLKAEEEKKRLETERLKLADAEKKRAAEFKAYKTRYLGNSNTRYSIAILVADETGQPNAPLGHALGTLLNTNGLTTTASLFTPEFIADGLFDKTIAGSKETFDKLELTNFVQVVLLAHQSVQYSTNSALDGVITATMTVEVNAFSTSAFQLLFADSIKAAGAGLSRLEARAMAEERVLKQFKDGRLGSVQKAVLTEGK
jgi:hypothetical protein